MSTFYEMYHEDEAFRESVKTLRTNIDFAGIDRPIRSVSVTSAIISEGKSTVALALAAVVAESGKSTIIVDNDFRHPQIENRLMVRGTHTMSELFRETATIVDCCVPTKIRNLSVFATGGKRITNPTELLSSTKYKEILSKLKDLYDFVVVDTPPLNLFVDAALVGTQVDGVLLTIGYGKSTESEVKDALGQLEKANANVLGAVFNGTAYNPTSYYGYYYGKQRDKKSFSRGR